MTQPATTSDGGQGAQQQGAQQQGTGAENSTHEAIARAAREQAGGEEGEQGQQGVQGAQGEQQRAGEAEETQQAQETQDGGDTEDGLGENTGAPDAYEAWDLPEGVEIREDMLTAFEGVVRQSNLDQEHAQAFVDLAVTYGNSIRDEVHAELQAQTQEWEQALRADPEFGKGNYIQSVAKIDAMLRRFGGDKTVQAMDLLGASAHPDIMKPLAEIARHFSEDTPRDTTPAGGREQATQPKADHEVLYGG